MYQCKNKNIILNYADNFTLENSTSRYIFFDERLKTVQSFGNHDI